MPMPTLPRTSPASAATAAPPLLDARGVSVSLGGVPILDDVDLTVRPGELVGIIGPNGAGKSTLARAVSGLVPATGTIEWEGRSLRKIRGRSLARLRAFVPQRPRVPEGIDVREAVMIGRSPYLRPLQRPSAEDHAAVARALERADAAPLAHRRLTTLSGGELQRVQIAVGLAQETALLIADEPTSALDLGATATIARLLRRLTADGTAVILVVHDLALAAAVADRVVVLSGGRSVAEGAPHDVLDRRMLADVWRVDAELGSSAAGRAALDVQWLASDGDGPDPVEEALSCPVTDRRGGGADGGSCPVM